MSRAGTPARERFKGYEADEIIGQHFSRFFTDEDRAAGVPAGRSRPPRARAGSRPKAGGSARTAPASGPMPCSTRSATTRGECSASPRSPATSPSARSRPAGAARSERASGCSSRASPITPSTCSTRRPGDQLECRRRAIKGYKADEIVGQHFSRFYTEEDRAAGEPARALAPRFAKANMRMRRGACARTAPLLGERRHRSDPRRGRRLIGFAKITRDITERRKASPAELEEARGALPVAEAAGARRADRRRRPRFQQSDDRDPRLGRLAAAPRPGPPRRSAPLSRRRSSTPPTAPRP
jgi:hypothetical protein